jgi:hypothetical protein
MATKMVLVRTNGEAASVKLELIVLSECLSLRSG